MVLTEATPLPRTHVHLDELGAHRHLCDFMMNSRCWGTSKALFVTLTTRCWGVSKVHLVALTKRTEQPYRGVAEHKGNSDAGLAVVSAVAFSYGRHLNYE